MKNIQQTLSMGFPTPYPLSPVHKESHRRLGMGVSIPGYPYYQILFVSEAPYFSSG